MFFISIAIFISNCLIKWLVHNKELQVIDRRKKHTQMKESSDRDFKINMTHMVKHLLDNVDNTHEPMKDFSRLMEIIKRNKRKCWK